MSVIVKNMKMPKNCKECPFSDHEAWCLIPGSWKERYYCPDDERSDDCPLVELPFAEELAEKLYKQIEKAVIEAEGETNGR